MNDVYVVHFEFTLEFLVLFFIPSLLAVVIINIFASIPVEGLYRKRRNEPIPERLNSVTIILMFTWPLYLLLVLVKMTLGGLAKLWSKI